MREVDPEIGKLKGPAKQLRIRRRRRRQTLSENRAKARKNLRK